MIYRYISSIRLQPPPPLISLEPILLVALRVTPPPQVGLSNRTQLAETEVSKRPKGMRRVLEMW